jgi:hypothetical protein
MRISGFLSVQHPLGFLAKCLLASLHSIVYRLSSSSLQHLMATETVANTVSYFFLFHLGSLAGLLPRALAEAFPLAP